MLRAWWLTHQNSYSLVDYIRRRDGKVKRWVWFKRVFQGGFLGDSLIMNPPASAGDTGSNSDPGRPHMLQSNKVCVPGFLGLCSRAQDCTSWAHMLHLLKPAHPTVRVLQQNQPLQWATCASQLEGSLNSHQLEKARAAKIHRTAKNK